MVCSADDFCAWKDFPKGLRVLLLDEDTESAAEIGTKLEAMEYIVSSFHNEKDAMEAILGKGKSYHVAIVEVTTISVHGNFTFLQVAKDLPTIVISNAYCFNTMMNCIALGAAEFLQKPLSDDKLRNIWQHVVHKALSAGGNAISKSLKPIEETASCTIQLPPNSKLPKIAIPSCILDDKYPAPSTPQLSKARRLEKNGDLEDQPECSDNDYAADAKEVVEMPNFGFSEAKSVDITCNNMTVAEHSDEAPASNPMDPMAKEKLDSTEKSNPDDSTRSAENEELEGEDPKRKKSFLHDSSCLNGFEGRRRKMKVDWTPELHKRFVRAVEQLGIDQAIPSKILELMKVDGLTRHNVASHLQKFRTHRRHILPKDDDKRWQVHRDSQQKGYMQKPIMAFTPYHSSYSVPQSNAYPIWPHPSCHLPHVQIWGHSGMPTWHSPQSNWQWKTSPEVHADTWGYPVLPDYGYSHLYIPTQGSTMSCIGFDSLGDKAKLLEGFYDLCQNEEIINEVVKEAMSKPWLPLPLGLKPPSTDTVLAELHRKGIHSIPPASHHQT